MYQQPKKDSFEQVALTIPSLPIDFEIEQEIKSRSDEIEAAFVSQLEEGKDVEYQIECGKKRLQEIQDNNQHIKWEHTRGKRGAFSKMGAVEATRVVKDFSGKYVKWVSNGKPRTFENMTRAISLLGLPEVLNKTVYQKYAGILLEPKIVPVITHAGGSYCFRLVNNEKVVSLPIILQEQVVKLQICDLNMILLKETSTKKEAAQFMNEVSGKKYDEDKLKKKLKGKIDKHRIRKTTDYERVPFPSAQFANGNTRFRLKKGWEEVTSGEKRSGDDTLEEAPTKKMSPNKDEEKDANKGN